MKFILFTDHCRKQSIGYRDPFYFAENAWVRQGNPKDDHNMIMAVNERGNVGSVTMQACNAERWEPIANLSVSYDDFYTRIQWPGFPALLSNYVQLECKSRRTRIRTRVGGGSFLACKPIVKRFDAFDARINRHVCERWRGYDKMECCLRHFWSMHVVHSHDSCFRNTKNTSVTRSCLWKIYTLVVAVWGTCRSFV